MKDHVLKSCLNIKTALCKLLWQINPEEWLAAAKLMKLVCPYFPLLFFDLRLHLLTVGHQSNHMLHVLIIHNSLLAGSLIKHGLSTVFQNMPLRDSLSPKSG